ncbi:hypothetical protein RND81_05G072700 [Saponaria officinalis]|uniref:Retrotransposon gag domain-containing protein n=1 Tax=Saponaria officinalis TaxID=3572 RepID=A0AAW1KTC3_SAPOF
MPQTMHHESINSRVTSVVDYYTHLKSIWDELATYSRVPACTCGAAAEFLKEKDEEKVHQFITGLNTALYDNLRSNLLMDDDLTSLNRVYALVLREECHKAVTRVREEPATEVAMSARTGASCGHGRGCGNPSQPEQEYEPPRCTHCNKWYNTEENCWEKLGINGRGRGRGRRGGRGGGRGGRGSGNNNQVVNATTTSEGESSKKEFTTEEMEQLRILLNAKAEGNEKLKGMHHVNLNEWMLDSGASHHMTGCRETLMSPWQGAPSTVGLPDGSTIIA